MSEFTDISRKLVDNIEKVIIGTREQILVVLSAIPARGHILPEDVPGVAKTQSAHHPDCGH